jgi:hypothetical protein
MIEAEQRLHRAAELMAKRERHEVRATDRRAALARAEARGLVLSGEQAEALAHITDGRDLGIVEAGPIGSETYIATRPGEPMTKESLGNLFKEKCIAAGLTNRSAHGSRDRRSRERSDRSRAGCDLRLDRSSDGEPLHEEGQPQETGVWRRCKARKNERLHGS